MRTLLLLAAILLVTASTLAVPAAFAEPHEKHDRQKSVAPQGVTPNQLIQAPTSRISNKRAASLVKEQYNSSRILGVSRLDDKGPPVFRVRTLTEDGVVKSVFVDGNSGEVFE